MKSTLLLSLIGWIILSACSGNREKGGEQEIPVMDMNATYAQREIPLQEVGAVRYIQLGTSDTTLVSEDMSLVPYPNSLFLYDRGSGDLIGYDSEGHHLCSFNRKGQGVNEYATLDKLVYDETNQLVYIFSLTSKVNLLTYDLKGNCLHANAIPDTLDVFEMELFDPQSLLICDMKHFKVIKEGKINKLAEDAPEANPYPFVLLHSKDGSLDTRLPLACPDHFRLLVFTQVDGRPFVQMARTKQLVRSGEGFLLNDFAIDSVYWLSKGKEIKPVFARTPSIHADVQKGKICDVLARTSRYMLIKVICLDPEEGSSRTGLKTALYLWDSKDRSFTECTFYNAEFKESTDQFREIAISGDKLYYRYFPDKLKDALKDHRLSGKLETLARSLGEDDNLILMEVSLADKDQGNIESN